MPQNASTTAPTTERKPEAHLAFLGLCCGVGVSTIYLYQPLLPQMGATFGADAAAAGQVGVATQVGYAVGMRTFTPMGDTRERRGLILKMFAAVSVSLLLEACAPTLPLLLFLSACAGAFASVTHIVRHVTGKAIPKALHLSTDAEEPMLHA